MKVIFFDTETTGLPKSWKKDALNAPDNWPDLVSIAWWVFESRELVKKEYHIIRPDGWTISEGSFEKHGISQEVALAQGKPLATVLDLFRKDLNRTYHLIAHNMNFDKNVLFNAYRWRLGVDPMHFWPTASEFCSMEASTAELRIPSKFGRPGDLWKWPGLDELYSATFGRAPPADAHNADRDVDVLQQIVWKRWSLLNPDGTVA
jgi:hypothetical protein